MGEGADQQIATEPLRRVRAMQLAPGKPQFGCRPIEQFGNLAVDLSGARTGTRFVPGVQKRLAEACDALTHPLVESRSGPDNMG